jgi:uncharacterized protein
MKDDMKAMLAHAYAESAKGNGRVLGDLLDESVVYVVQGQTPWSGVYRGKSAMLERCIAPVHRRLKRPARFWADRIIVDGDVAAVEGHGENETLEGKAYNNTYCWVLRFSGGKIVEMVEYMDSVLTSDVLGVPGEGEGPMPAAV